MRIDSHQHFWTLNEQDYPWIQRDWPIHRDFGPGELEPLLDAHGFDGCIAVQARQTLSESESLLAVAKAAPRVLGVVGWVDLRAEALDDDLARLCADPRFVGARHIAQDEPDDSFLSRPDVQRGIGRLARYGLTYDVLVFERQLPSAIELVRRFPEQSFVLDHIAKPKIRSNELSPWRERIRELARSPNVVCKVSGLVTEADWEKWSPAQLKPYLDVVLEAFGPERVLFGSDWPVCTLAASYTRVVDVAEAFSEQFSASERERFFGGTAYQVYGLGRAR